MVMMRTWGSTLQYDAPLEWCALQPCAGWDEFACWLAKTLDGDRRAARSLRTAAE
jgi:hypothetical protein